MMINKIMVPLDGSEWAEKALPYAEELAYKFEAEVVLAWILQPVVIMSDFGTTIHHEQIEREGQEASAYLDNLQKKLDKLRLHTRVVVSGGRSTAEAIIEQAAEESVDLIVMTTHGRSGLSRWVYGSVANKVLQHALCPVYLIREK